jgi:protein-S-isoprenylcysteine O-methyltransferase Ste14
MTRASPSAAIPPQPAKRSLAVRALLQAVLLPLVFGTVLFLPAATLRWPLAWALLAAYITGMLLTNLWLVMRHPGLARERLIIPRSSERWDLRLIQVTNFTLLGITLPLSGLDHRFTWSPAVPLAVSLIALLLFAGTFLFMDWAMSVNDFFSSAVRLQNDRGQAVATGGPYRIVRHPGYLAMIIQFLTIPFVLGSVLSLIPVIAIVIAYAYRTDREDRLLHGKLPGYADYANRVRFRLIPGIW